MARGVRLDAAFFRHQGIRLLQVLLIVAAGIWIYLPTLHATWYGDDGLYLINNPLMNDSDRLWKAWFEPGSFIEYYPLAETVQWYQWQLWGMRDVFGYRVTNLVLDIFSALLVWRLFSKFSLRLAWLGGLLFVIHPMMVDTVAVICELKSTLSLPFFLLAMCFYIDFEEKGKSRYYILALTMFLMGMLCKITMFFFPLMILIYAWWKRERITMGGLKAAAPFFVISLVLGLVTLYSGASYAKLIHYNPPCLIHLGGVFSRIALAGLSLEFYFSRCFFPLYPMPLYPMWKIDPPSPWQFLTWLGFVLVIYACWKKRHGWGRHVLLGLAFFVLGLVPFLGFNEVSYMCFAWVQDHFLYLPILGIIGLVVAALGHAGSLLPKKYLLLGIAGVVLAASLLAFQAYSYAKIFADKEQLQVYNLRYNPDSWFTRYQLARTLLSKGHLAESVDQLRESLRTNPDFRHGYYYLGLALNEAGKPAEAIEPLKALLKIEPDNVNGHIYLSNDLLATGRVAEAIEQLQQIIQILPASPEARNQLGIVFARTGRLPEAMEQFQHAVDIDPNYVPAHVCLGTILVKLGRISEGRAEYERALQIDPNNSYARDKLARLLGR